MSSKFSRESPAAEKVHVSTEDGDLVVDRVEGHNGASWLRARGIQYAEHPIGALRWQPPVPKQPDLKHAADATQWGDDCIQGPFMSRISAIQANPMSESCLYLNVWAPDNSTKKEKAAWPVLIWFHGGSFTMGGTTSYNADGVFSYRRNAIIVTANYRLGALGFLGSKAIQKSTSDGSSGNFGLQDTRLAMKWVRRNIASFGGDPLRVTIFGESAGASMVETHLSAPRSNGFFHSAIMQSGAFDNYTIQRDPEGTFVAFAAGAGCNPDSTDVMECLRKTPLWANPDKGFNKSLMPALSSASQEAGFGPTIDFVELTESPEASAKAKRLNNFTSAIIGTNLNEGRFLMPLMMPLNNGPQSTRPDLHQWLQDFYPSAVEQISKQYSSELETLTPWEVAATIYTDSQYLCPTQRSARWLAEVGADTFVYRLEYKPTIFDVPARIVFQEMWCSDYSMCDNVSMVDPGVGHSADVYLLFNDPRMNALDFTVAHKIVDYWMNFASTGNPSEGNTEVAAWPTFMPSNSTMQLAPDSASTANLRQSYCDFWADIKSGLPPLAKHLPIIV